MLKKVFLIGGMSESGKSTVGRYFDSHSVKRLKIITYLRRVMEKEGATGDFQDWNDRAEAGKPNWLAQRFMEEFVESTNQEGVEYCCLESLYRPEFGRFIRRSLANRVVIVYVDAPLEIRIQRQMTRESLVSVGEAKKLLIPRDQKKEEWGTHRLKEIADVVIDNSKTKEDLHRQVKATIARYCPELNLTH